MEANLTEGADSSLFDSYQACFQSFGKFVLALRDSRCRIIHLEQVQLDDVLQEYGRIRIWGSQTQAELPPRARGSLDDTLRQDEKLKYLTKSILMRLARLLDQGISPRQYLYCFQLPKF